MKVILKHSWEIYWGPWVFLKVWLVKAEVERKTYLHFYMKFKIEWRPLVVSVGCAVSLRPGLSGALWWSAASVVVWLTTRKMASGVRQELAQLMNSSGSHKDLAGKYVFSNHLPVLVLTICLLHECIIVQVILLWKMWCCRCEDCRLALASVRICSTDDTCQHAYICLISIEIRYYKLLMVSRY